MASSFTFSHQNFSHKSVNLIKKYTKSMTIILNLLSILFFLNSDNFQLVDAFSKGYSSTKIKQQRQNSNGLLHMSSNCHEFEEDRNSKQNNAFLSQYTFNGVNSQSNLFQREQIQECSRIMSNAYQTPSSGSFLENIGAILSCSLLVTGTSVGAGTMVLPEVASGPGMFISILVFIGKSIDSYPHIRKCAKNNFQIIVLIGLYIVNVVSGIIIGEVSIQQYEKSEASASSFKALADGMFNSEIGGIAIAWISIIINWCVLAFGLKRGGTLALPCLSYCSNLFSTVDPNIIAGGLSAFLTVIVFAQSEKQLSNMASKVGSVLSASFVAVLVSGLMGMQENPIFIPGTETNMISAVSYAAPIFLTSMVYQNIVPTIAKLVNYDRFQLNASLVLGSGLPLVMYVGYCLASLGGGISSDISVSTSAFGACVPIFLNTFYYSAVIASSICCSISLVEEFQSLLASNTDNDKKKESSSSVKKINEVSPSVDSTSTMSTKLQSTVYAIFPPFVAGAVFSNSDCFNDALSLAGSYFSPILYGILPVLLASKLGPETNIPGGKGSLALLGVSTTAFMGLQLINDFGITL